MACYGIYKGADFNNACYYVFRVYDDSMIIIIKDNQHPYDNKTVNKYLKCLKECFDIEFHYKKVKKEFHVNVNKIKNIALRITCCMCVRFLWEGYKSPNNYDTFYTIIPFYLEFVRHFPTKDKFELLCIACNYYLDKGPSFNSNHFLTYGAYHVKLTSPNEINTNGSVNEYFKGKSKTPSNIILTNKKSYVAFYEFIKNIK